MTDCQKLLADYARNGSEDAFRALVTRYVNFVYSAAIRLVDGDTLLAQDVAQVVFIDLAQSAQKISREVMLGGWLHRHTCFVAAKTMRSERRRKIRERHAVEMNALQDSPENNLAPIKSILDDVIDRLNEDDRAAILLRFFEQRDFRSVGEALGTTENTARMKVNRALEKLELLLKKRGVVFPTAALAMALTAEAASAAPATMALTVSNVALTAAATKTGASAFTILKIMAATKLKIGVVSVVVVAGVTTSLLLQNRARGRIDEKNSLLSKQATQISQLQADNDRLSRIAANPGFSPEQSDELQKLRGETTALRNQTNEFTSLREEYRQLKTPPPQTPQQDAESNVVRISYSKQWVLAFMMFAQDHQDRFPAAFADASTYAGNELTSRTDISPDEFEITYSGKLSDVKEPAKTIVLREKQARKMSNDRWAKAYGFADGHCETHKEPTDNFDAWEKEHLVKPSAQ